MLFQTCSFSFLAFLSQVMTSIFKAKPRRFFFKNVYLKHVRIYLKMLTRKTKKRKNSISETWKEYTTDSHSLSLVEAVNICLSTSKFCLNLRLRHMLFYVFSVTRISLEVFQSFLLFVPVCKFVTFVSVVFRQLSPASPSLSPRSGFPRKGIGRRK